MNENAEYYSSLITRYFSGETTEDELHLLSEWLKADRQNEALFSELLKTWQLVEKQKINSTLDSDKEWIALREKMNVPVSFKHEHRDRKIMHIAFKNVWRIAALLIVLLGFSFLIYNYFSGPSEIVIVAKAGNIEQVLPDGSMVSLHAGSRISYPERFSSKKRNVMLDGEAYFKVARNELKPFIVASGDARVEVLGTQFNVNTRKSAGKMEVVLTNGKVSVYYRGKQKDKVLLMPGEKAEIFPISKVINKTINTDPNYMAWKTMIIVFDDQPLQEVVSTLQNIYQKNITISGPQLAQCRVSASFNNQSLQSVLEVISETLDLKVKYNKESVELTGNGCR
jgi:transmembrane sensor